MAQLPKGGLGYGAMINQYLGVESFAFQDLFCFKQAQIIPPVHSISILQTWEGLMHLNLGRFGDTLQGTNISHPAKRNILPLKGDMLVRRGV